MSLQKARSVDEYVEWVKQAMFEVGDLKDCLLYEEENLLSFPEYIEPMEVGIKKMYQDMLDGNYAFGREDLPFMEAVYRHEADIPFHTLLKQINETHRHGLDVEDDED